jgi:hypothetical protein
LKRKSESAHRCASEGLPCARTRIRPLRAASQPHRKQAAQLSSRHGESAAVAFEDETTGSLSLRCREQCAVHEQLPATRLGESLRSRLRRFAKGAVPPRGAIRPCPPCIGATCHDLSGRFRSESDICSTKLDWPKQFIVFSSAAVLRTKPPPSHQRRQLQRALRLYGTAFFRAVQYRIGINEVTAM